MKTARPFLLIATAIVAIGIAWYLLARPGAEPTPPGDAPSENPALKGEVTIGAIIPLTGEAASYGLPIRKAMDLAVERINATTGVAGKALRIEVEDGMCDKAKAAEAGERLMDGQQVKIILGGICSGETTGFLPMADERGIVAISPSATSPTLSAANDAFFRFAPSDALAGRVAATYAYTTLSARRAAVISEETDYAQGLRRVFTAAYADLGGTVALDRTYRTGTTDFRALARAVEAADVDVVYLVPQGDAPGIAAAQALKDADVDATVLTAEILIGQALVAANAQALEGIIGFEAHFDTTTDRAAQFVKDYTERYGEGLAYPFYMANMYSMVYLAKDLIELHGEDSAAMRRTLDSLTDWAGGALADVTLDRAGDIIWKSYAVRLVQDGAIVRKEVFSLE